MNFFDEETEVVGYVTDQLRNLELGSALTMTIGVGPYGGFCVHTATAGSSGDTELPKGSVSFEALRNI